MPDTLQFRGSVIPHQVYDLTPGSNSLAAYEIFRDYWTYGFDPEVGLDAPLSQPNSIKALAIGHAHLKPVKFTGRERKDHGYRASEAAWNCWEYDRYTPGVEAPSLKTPTSNEWLVYCVDDNRNACLLAHIESAAHQMLKATTAELRAIMTLAERWFQAENRAPMQYDEMNQVFSAKWKITT